MEQRTFEQAPANDGSRDKAEARYAHMRVLRRRQRGLVGAIAVVAVLIAAVLAGILYVSHLNNLIETRDRELLASLKEQASDEPFYMLLLGVDKGEERYGTEGTDSSNYRADTIMLTRIDPRMTKATIVSIHRDLLVELQNGEMGKINAAYSLGGPAGMVQQVSSLAGVDINHYAEIDFDSFMSIVDAVGGVEVTLPIDVRDPEYTGLDLSAGTHVLNGHDALMLCRARHAYDEYGDGDLYRAANQRMVVSAIVSKVLSTGPHAMVSAISSMAGSVTTDLSLNDILALAAQMQDFDADSDLYSGMTPSEPEVIDDVYYEILDADAWAGIMQRTKAGLPPYESEDQDVTSGVAAASGADARTPAAPSAAPSDASPETPAETPSSQPDDTNSPKTSLSGVDTTGGVAVIGINDGRATALADELALAGFDATAYEDPSYAFGRNLVVYGDPALANEAEALASYLGNDFVAMPNDGSFYLITDIVIRLA